MAYTFYKPSFDAGWNAAAIASVVRPEICVDLQKPGGGTHSWSTRSAYSDWGYDTTGYIYAVSFPDEKLGLEETTMSITITAVPAAVAQSLVGYSMYDQLYVYLYILLLDADGNELANRYWIMFFADAELSEDVDGPTIQINAAMNTAYWDRPRELTYTDECHQNRYCWKSSYGSFSGDVGFEFVPDLADWTGFWGKRRRTKRSKRNRKVNKDN